jgi:hypothetical protein
MFSIGFVPRCEIADVMFEEADAEFDNPVAIGVSAVLVVSTSTSAATNVDRWVVCGLRAPADW